MKPFSVVKDLDIIKQIPFHFIYRFVFVPVKILLFQAREKALHAAVVIWTACLAHTAADFVLCQHRLISAAAILASSVAVKDQCFILLFPMQRVSQCSAGQFFDPVYQFSLCLRLFFLQSFFFGITWHSVFPPVLTDPLTDGIHSYPHLFCNAGGGFPVLQHIL